MKKKYFYESIFFEQISMIKNKVSKNRKIVKYGSKQCEHNSH